MPAATVRRSASAIWRTRSNAIWPFIMSLQHLHFVSGADIALVRRA
jgi:hypothetical protein